ncbi:MAG: YdcF family protein, partial [Lachnospiraceae bacterium]|nr:YdcF family protein [Lachnospiraceae bacterium]
NTKENIQNSSQLLDKSKDRVGIVTNNFHVYRGLSIAKKQGYAHAYGVSVSSSAPYLINNMLREGLGILKDFAVGNL